MACRAERRGMDRRMNPEMHGAPAVEDRAAEMAHRIVVRHIHRRERRGLGPGAAPPHAVVHVLEPARRARHRDDVPAATPSSSAIAVPSPREAPVTRAMRGEGRVLMDRGLLTEKRRGSGPAALQPMAGNAGARNPWDMRPPVARAATRPPSSRIPARSCRRARPDSRPRSRRRSSAARSDRGRRPRPRRDRARRAR